jgi:hypothetical protein
MVGSHQEAKESPEHSKTKLKYQQNANNSLAVAEIGYAMKRKMF